MAGTRVPVAIEATPKRTFAFAVDWPGWCRAGKDEALALEALVAYAGAVCAGRGGGGARVPGIGG